MQLYQPVVLLALVSTIVDKLKEKGGYYESEITGQYATSLPET
jgi:hypothetical protein